ncbi:MAG: hypothetical protein KatS3mg060_3482 [Dehalococcoidia bacterium]|nr:MAG: hypothetical protein KatS3mg060_3482 [Dehalococcoidia bacterium]
MLLVGVYGTVATVGSRRYTEDTTDDGAESIQREQNQPESLAERRIREAMEEGQFRDLRGRGRPLDLGHDEIVDRDQWAANKVLQNAGILPAWIELAKEIDALHDMLESLLAEQRRWLELVGPELRALGPRERARRRLGVESIQRRYLGRAGGIAEELRAKLARFNMIVPQAFLQKAPIRIERRLEPLLAAYRPLAGEHGWPEVAVPPPIPPPGSDPGVPQPLFPPTDVPADEHDRGAEQRAEERRAKLIEASAKLRKRRPERGVPLEWLAALNPLSHAADVLRRRRWQSIVDPDDE